MAGLVQASKKGTWRHQSPEENLGTWNQVVPSKGQQLTANPYSLGRLQTQRNTRNLRLAMPVDRGQPLSLPVGCTACAAEDTTLHLLAKKAETKHILRVSTLGQEGPDSPRMTHMGCLGLQGSGLQWASMLPF
jgi:hypothetical protein